MTQEDQKVHNRVNVQIGYNLRCVMLRAQKKNRRLKQSDIAKQAGIHEVTLSRILNGSGASVMTITKIAEVIGADPKRILTVGIRQTKLKARSFEEILNNTNKMNQFIGYNDVVARNWTRRKLIEIVTALKKHRVKLERQSLA